MSNNKTSIKKHTSISDYYNRIGPRYRQIHKARGAYFDWLCTTIHRVLDLQPGSKILEVGCGIGRFTIPLLKWGYQLVALDLSESSLEILRATANQLALSDRLRTICTSIESFRQKEFFDCFDAALGGYVLHHVADAQEAVESMRLAVKKNGKVICLEPNPLNPMWYLQILFIKDIQWQIEKGMIKLTRRKLKSIFENAGLSNVEILATGLFPPQLINLLPSSANLEKKISKVPVLNKLLSIHFIQGKRI